MTSRERLTLTLAGEKGGPYPRVPFLWYNNMFEMFGYIPEIDTNYDPPDFDIISKWVEYCDVFGFDVMFRRRVSCSTGSSRTAPPTGT